jgi:2,4-dienoyl-CoA reductase-like NADH-dependent reductase (Old Yellow Enzyme family)
MSKSLLFTPLQIKNTVFKNRIVISPMCQYSAENGFANNWHLVHLGSRAVGGAALIMQEATAVSPEGRITYGDLGLWLDDQMQKLQEIVSFLHNNNAKAGIQLAHAGRKASCEVPWLGGYQFPPDHPNGWQTVGCSPVAFKEEQHPPVELDQQGINKVIDDFVAATKRALQIGYDVVEIHAAHGYLIHQFYSPLSNFRKDKYGGSFENRTRLLMDVTDAVQSVWGKERPLFVRISATDWTEGGWAIEDSIRLCAMLKAKGVDFIDVSSGGNALVKIPAEPGYQVQFAERIKKETGIYCGAVGLITKTQQAEAILEQHQADMIFIARESLRNPYFPLRASSVLENSIDWPVQYQRAGGFE